MLFILLPFLFDKISEHSEQRTKTTLKGERAAPGGEKQRRKGILKEERVFAVILNYT
jgi:hypothetical protein